MCLSNLKCSATFKVAVMSKCNVLFKSQFCSTLVSFPLLADYLSVKLTKEASLYLSHIVQTAKFLPNNNIVQLISYVICLANITNKGNIIYWSSMKCKKVTRGIHAADLFVMAHRLSIEKQHWGRYQTGRKKLYQHQYYGIGGTGEYKQASMK